MIHARARSGLDEVQALFDALRPEIRVKLAQRTLAQSITGKGRLVDGPLRPQPLLSADYAASGRALRKIG